MAISSARSAMSCVFWRREAESLGVEIYPGFAGAEMLYGEKGEVSGVATGDMGVARDGTPQGQFYARHGAARQIYADRRRRARLAVQAAHRQIRPRTRIASRRNSASASRSFGASRKRSTSPASSSTLSAGRSTSDTGGGSFLYHFEEDLVSVGFVVHLNYTNPTLSPFDEFQRFKTHPMIAPTFEGGERLSYGARALTEGGWQSVPKLVFPGGALIGCAAGFMNVPRIKGSHNAMLSGMLAAEHICQGAVAKAARMTRSPPMTRVARLRHRPRSETGAQRQAALVEIRNLSRRAAFWPRHVDQ